LNQAELLAIQRLIQSKRKDGDENAVRTLKQNLYRKQARVSHLWSKETLPSQVENSCSAFNGRPHEECFSFMIINQSEGCSGATDASAWRMFWQGLRVHFMVDLLCCAVQGSDTANYRTEASVERSMALIADAIQNSQAQRKFMFFFISCPVSESEPASLLLDSGQRITFNRLHEWLGSLSQHDCMLVFETGGNAFAQTALDVSCIKGFSGSIVSGCLGLADAGVICSPTHPWHLGICVDMGLLSFTIIEALLSASTNLRCDEVRLFLFRSVSLLFASVLLTP
jgi:hypothetical protein